MVSIGLVSYSAYLWHQPLFAFTKYSLIEPTTTTMLLLCIAVIPLAYLSWYFVEQPFRKKGIPSRKIIFSVSILLSVLFISLGLYGHFQNGDVHRWDQHITQTLNAKNDKNPKQGQCHFSSDFPLPPVEKCWLNKSVKKSVVILGDSHADALAYELANSLQKFNLNLQQHTYSGCIPIYGLKRARKPNHQCAAYNWAAYKWLRKDDQIETIILHGRWTLYAETHRFNNRAGGIEPGGKEKMTNLNDTPINKQQTYTVYRQHILKLLELGKNVLLVYPIPEAGWDIPKQTARKMLLTGNQEPSLDTSFSVFQERNRDTISALDEIQHPNLYRFYPHQYFCKKETGRCINADNKGIYYYDDDHLSNTGARMISNPLAKSIASLPKRQ